MNFSVRLAVVIYVGFLLAGSLLVYRDQAVAYTPHDESDVQLATPADDARAIDAPGELRESMRLSWDREAGPLDDMPAFGIVAP